MPTTVPTTPKSLPQLSCIPNDPLMRMGTDGDDAPTLNYSLPQKASFTSYGDVRIPVDRQFFNDKAFVQPAAVERLKNFSKLEIMAKLRAELERGARSSDILFNVGQSDSISLLQTATSPTGTEAAPALRTLAVGDVGTQPVLVGELADQPVLVPQKAVLSNDQTIKTTLAVGVGTDLEAIAEAIVANKAPMLIRGFGGFLAQVRFINRPLPENVVPMLFIVEEYKTASYLGNYGAGQTLSTFSLLPGERTTISIKTFTEETSSASRAENIMDSFSENSAKEMEDLIEEDSNMSDSDESNTSTTEERSKNTKSAVSLSASGKIAGIVKVSAKASLEQSTSASSKNTSSSKASRSSNVKSLSKALEKHVDSSNSARNVNVNTTGTQTSRSSTEESTIRELVNPNKSRVLNFVFRQLLQEYITITYLTDIKLVFTNGHPESTRIATMEQMDQLLYEVMFDNEEVQRVRAYITKEYGNVRNYRGEEVDFIEAQTYTAYGEGPGTYYRKTANQFDQYTAPDGCGGAIDVPGVILNVDQNILRTESVIVDSLLGQGEALDCFNMKVQDAEGQRLYLENERVNLGIETLRAVTDPAQRAELYAKMFNAPATTIVRTL